MSIANLLTGIRRLCSFDVGLRKFGQTEPFEGQASMIFELKRVKGEEVRPNTKYRV